MPLRPPRLLAFLSASLLFPALVRASSPYGEEAVRLLRSYIQVDTTNPPGSERKGADFLKEILEAEGIAVRIDEFAPGRANLLARLKGNGSKGALVLAAHMDVVPADASGWTVPPFSGALQNGLIYGRGAQDMKDEGIVHLLSFLRLKRENVPLDRDVLLLATADEEEGFHGALRAASAEGFLGDLRGAEYLITEGGEALLGADQKPVSFAVDTAEKAVFWLKLRATASPGHAAEPQSDSAPNRLVRALERVRLHKTPLKLLPAVDGFFKAQAARVGGERGSWYRDLRQALRRPDVVRVLEDDPSVNALLRNTVSITQIQAGYKTNVIPGSAEAHLDVRLLPGEDPEDFLKELRDVVADPAVEVTTLGRFFPPNSSPADTALFGTLTRVLARHYPGTSVTPSLLTGATESVIYRPLGLVCYGFTPILATREEIDSEHGNDERVRESSLREATDVFYEVVLELCRH